uniref:Uncharacterized protein n=1 Tax=Oryza sativa subsp. japonica TaxID=39947 RepID=Q6H4R8_ORYSJ|nr:hypothetical protein [Oryza sativa Japonica Group]BAD26281.1 hypothetical protein [Oryza sativa Japonica Group]
MSAFGRWLARAPVRTCVPASRFRSYSIINGCDRDLPIDRIRHGVLVMGQVGTGMIWQGCRISPWARAWYLATLSADCRSE